MTITFFFNVTDTGRAACQCLHSYLAHDGMSSRIMVRNWAIDHLLLHCLPVACVVSWHLCSWRVLDGRYFITQTYFKRGLNNVLSNINEATYVISNGGSK